MKRLLNRTFLYTILPLALFLVSCSPYTTIYTGPEVHVGPASISLIGNSRGEVLLQGELAARLVGNEYLGVNWLLGFEQTLVSAKQTEHYLYILSEDHSGSVYRDTYRIGESFQVNFRNEDWVRQITTDSRGNVVVFVEKDRISEYYSTDLPLVEDAETTGCLPEFPPRLAVGSTARVIVFQITVRTGAGTAAPLVRQKYFAQNRILHVQDGPRCANGLRWWKVYCDELGFGGWVAEADKENYYLSP